MKTANLRSSSRHKRIAAAEPTLEPGTGRVLVSCEDRIVVEHGHERFSARRAASCLLRPEAGDLVAWYGTAGATAWIIAVLERAAAAEQRLDLRGDVRLQVGGRFHIESAEALRLDSPRLELQAGEADVKLQRATISAQTLETIVGACEVTLGRLRLVGTELRSVFERVFQHAQHQHRSVEQLDRLEAGVIDHRARTLASVRGEVVLTNGERLIKSRAAQIQLG